MLAFYKKKYVTRHKILKSLQDHSSKTTDGVAFDQPIYDSDIALNITQISEATDIEKKEIVAEIEILLDRKEVQLTDDPSRNDYFITKKGSVAFFDQTYLEDGKKSLLTTIKESITIITTLGLFIIAIYSFIDNITKTENNSYNIEIIKNKLDSLEEKFKGK